MTTGNEGHIGHQPAPGDIPEVGAGSAAGSRPPRRPAWKLAYRIFIEIATVAALGLAVLHMVLLHGIVVNRSYVQGFSDYPELLADLSRSFAQISARASSDDQIYLALDFVGYGHFTKPDGFEFIYNTMQDYGSRAHIVTLNHEQQRDYLMSAMLKSKAIETQALKDRLRTYLPVGRNDIVLNAEAFSSRKRLDELLTKESLSPDEDAEFRRLTIDAIMVTEAHIEDMLIQNGAILYRINDKRDLPMDVVVFPELDRAYIGVHVPDKGLGQNVMGVRLQDDPTSLRAMQSAWDEYRTRATLVQRDHASGPG